MVARFQLLSVLLVCSWLELDYCSPFPRAWQVAREEQDAYGFGNRHYVQAPSEPTLQSIHQVNSEPRPWGAPWTHTSQAQIQHQPSLYRHTHGLNQPWPVSSSQPQSQVPPSKGFQFNFQVPMVDAPSQSKENSSSARGQSSDGRGSGPAAYNPRPSSIQVQSSFNSPSVLNRFLGQSGGKKPQDDSKPSFGLSLSLPIATTDLPLDPSANSESDRLAENARPDSVNTDHKFITYSPEHNPASHVWVHNPYQASPQHSWQPENIYAPANGPSVYQYWRDQSGQMALPSPNNAYLSLAPWQYVVPSRPSGTNYGPYRLCHLDGSPLTMAEQRDLFLQTYDWQVPAGSQRPALQSYAPLPQQPFFDYGKVSSTANYQMANMMPVGETGFFSFNPYNPSLHQNGQDAVPPSAFHLTHTSRVPGSPGAKYNYFY